MLYLFIVNSFVVALVVIIHYEFLYQMSEYLPKLHIRHRARIVIGVLGSLIAHAVEVWVFASAYYLMIHYADLGNLEGNFTGTFNDCVYYSFTTFTTLGFGDIYPSGGIRFLTGIESLTGLVLITWSASFLYIEMQKYWEAKR